MSKGFGADQLVLSDADKAAIQKRYPKNGLYSVHNFLSNRQEWMGIVFERKDQDVIVKTIGLEMTEREIKFWCIAAFKAVKRNRPGPPDMYDTSEENEVSKISSAKVNRFLTTPCPINEFTNEYATGSNSAYTLINTHLERALETVVKHELNDRVGFEWIEDTESYGTVNFYVRDRILHISHYESYIDYKPCLSL